jgi:hypothetical protein
MDEVRELDGILDEEDGNVVSHDIWPGQFSSDEREYTGTYCASYQSCLHRCNLKRKTRSAEDIYTHGG